MLTKAAVNVNLQDAGCYNLPKVYSTDESLTADFAEMSEFVEGIITLQLDDLTVEPGMEFYDAVLEKSGDSYTVSKKQVQNYVKREQDLGNRVYYTPYNKNDLEEYSRENIVENYQNELTVDYILTLYGIGEVTILISCIAPLVYMTRLKPKDIMIGGA